MRYTFKKQFIRFRTANIAIKELEKNKLPQIQRIFSRIDLFSKKECAGGT